MLDRHICLSGSRDVSGYLSECFRCNSQRPTNDGVNLGSGKWVCGKCWRARASSPAGALAHLRTKARAT